MSNKKVLIIGLDCVTPELLFDKWLEELPNIKKLAENGIYGQMESTIPPITVPAWMSMVTSKDPGELGFYGFRNRIDYSYSELDIATSVKVKEDTLWDILSAADRKVIVLGVPQTYPINKEINGCMVTGFLTPDTNSRYTYPDSLKGEIEKLVGEYIIDVEKFRTEDKNFLLRQIYEMTEKRFKVAEYLLSRKEWDFFMMVEMGSDRIHHGMWKYFDETHKKHPRDSKFKNAIKNYYKFLDEKIGEILSRVSKDTVVLVVSDHGAKRLDGGICVNDWLIKEGYLAMKNNPKEITRFDIKDVDWSKTKAWGEGGYYARIFLNVKGREPDGQIEKRSYEKERDELAARLKTIKNENGKLLNTRVFKAEEIYRECRNIPSDLIVYFDDLRYRSIGSIGNEDIVTLENDIGPDDVNHSQFGVFIMSPAGPKSRMVKNLRIYDVAPTVLDLMGVDIPSDMIGETIERERADE